MTQNRERERGSAMLVTMIIIAALLAGAAVLASMQMSSNRSTELTRNGLAALYCAEAGLTAARRTVPTNYALWDAALLANCTDDGECTTVIEPAWLSTIDHDIDGDTVADFVLSIKDNDDDATFSDDADDTVYIVSRCTKYPDSPRQVEELMNYVPAMNPYACQGGSINSRGNDNDALFDNCDGI